MFFGNCFWEIVFVGKMFLKTISGKTFLEKYEIDLCEFSNLNLDHIPQKKPKKIRMLQHAAGTLNKNMKT